MLNSCTRKLSADVDARLFADSVVSMAFWLHDSRRFRVLGFLGRGSEYCSPQFQEIGWKGRFLGHIRVVIPCLCSGGTVFLLRSDFSSLLLCKLFMTPFIRFSDMNFFLVLFG